MIEFYPQIKSIHVWMVLLSGALFALRGLGVLLAARWPMAMPVRIASYAIDTTLLTAALMLLTMLPTSMALPMAEVIIDFSSCRARHRERKQCGSDPRCRSRGRHGTACPRWRRGHFAP